MMLYTKGIPSYMAREDCDDCRDAMIFDESLCSLLNFS